MAERNCLTSSQNCVRSNPYNKYKFLDTCLYISPSVSNSLTERSVTNHNHIHVHAYTYSYLNMYICHLTQ